jgi:hypothetical protein
MNTKIVLTLTAALAALAAAGCKKTMVNPNDSTPPQVEIKVRSNGGAYTATNEVKLGVNDSLDLMCVATDNDGLSSVSMDFSGAIGYCNVQGSVYSGSFTVQPLPAPMTQPVQPDSNGNVLTSVPLLATLKGPFTCQVPGNGTGTPYGQTIKVTCTGQNWSSNAQNKTTQAVLKVDLQ